MKERRLPRITEIEFTKEINKPKPSIKTIPLSEVWAIRWVRIGIALHNKGIINILTTPLF